MTDPAIITAAAIWTYTNENDLSFVFNDAGAGNFNVPEQWPFALLDWPVTGSRALPNLDDNTDQNTEVNGFRELDAYARGRILVLAGKLYEQDFASLHVAINTMLAAFGPDPDTGKVLAGRLVVDAAPMSANNQIILGVPRSGYCNEDYIGDGAPGNEENEQPSPFHASFSFEVRCSDGRWFDWDPLTETASAPKW